MSKKNGGEGGTFLPQDTPPPTIRLLVQYQIKLAQFILF